MSGELTIADKILVIHDALGAARLPHAFGGALALAWCTQRARGTIDIDVNVFVENTRAREVLDALPIPHTEDDATRCVRDGQVRIWWDTTPVDIFTNTTEFHVAVARRSVTHEFASRLVPFLSCSDLAVFKAFFARSRDWADIEEMITAGSLDTDQTLGALTRYLGTDDERVERLRSLLAPGPS